MSKLVYIYKDEGCLGTDFVEAWALKNLSKADKNVTVKFIGADEIRGGCLNNETTPDLLIIPGGEAKHYSQHLRKKGLEEIQRYANREDAKTHIIGICAGAAYLSGAIEYVCEKANSACRYNENIDVEGCEDGLVCLFKGKAVGYYPDLKTSGKGSTREVEFASDKSANLYFYRGPTFLGISEEDEVLAKFSDNEGLPAVIVTGQNKNVTLMSVHPEYGENNLKDHGLKADQKEIDDFSEFIFKPITGNKKERPSSVFKTPVPEGAENAL